MKKNKILNTLYDYQRECVLETDKNKNGIVVLPTGTGKTFVQASIIARDILKHKNKFKMYVVNAPRIMLSYQLLKEVYSFLVGNGLEARYMCVHSGGQADIEDLEKIRLESNLDGNSIPFSEIESGTSTTLIKEMMEKAKRQNLPLIFFSTYNSAERIEGPRAEIGDKIEIIMNDEAHYLVQERFHDILHILKSDRCYFFTATTVHTPSDTGRGMNNKESYGEIIYKMTPREAIDRGKMVRPRMHFVLSKGAYNKDDFQTSLGLIIAESFAQHRYAIGNFTKPKILVSVKGVGDIKRFFESKEYKGLIRSGVDIYAVASDDSIGNNINGEKVSRQEFLKRLKVAGRDHTKELIVLHYDILAEGIDVSGFSGILPLRTLSKSKFLQTYGRAARLDPDDRMALEKGEMGPNDLDKFMKPYAWVIVPTIIHEDADNKEHIGNLITELRDYGFNPSEDIVSTDETNGLPTLDGPEGLNNVKKKCPNIGLYIEKVEASYEDERIAKLSKLELLKEKLGDK